MSRLTISGVRRRIEDYWLEFEACLHIGRGVSGKISLLTAMASRHRRNLSGRASRDGGSLTRHPIRLGTVASTLLLRRETGDYMVFSEVFASGAYLLRGVVPDRVRLVVDLGANVGLATLFFIIQYPRARVVAVEPDRDNFELLRQNTTAVRDICLLVEGAVNVYTGHARFDTSETTYNGRLSEHNALSDSSRQQIVPCFTMEDILARHGLLDSFIDVLKVDIEGTEQQLFGASPVWLRRVGVLVAELHGAYRAEHLARDLAPFGFTVLPPGSRLGSPTLVCAVSQRGQTLLGAGAAASALSTR
jgi:FkbM family methyltransferase